MRIEEAWKAGFTGRGVSVSILVRPHMIRMDDGLDYHHNDLRDAFTAEISFDFTNNRPDPTPENGPQFSHGTHCAGIVSMTANNSRYGKIREREVTIFV
uniref:Peptidase_S8 domain-containing protein n=1 Tax=Heterorhabditis bacteriophora TaxID=37862 RepID=A0A1I7WEJ8_HETBA